MDNRFNKIATKQNFTELGISSDTYLSETIPNSDISNAEPAINIKQMIDGRVNFNIIYNIVKNKKSNGVGFQNGSASNVAFQYDYNITSIMYHGSLVFINDGRPSNISCGGSSSMNSITGTRSAPTLITNHCGSSMASPNIIDSTTYYFIPASSTSGTAYINHGISSTCWNYPLDDDTPKYILTGTNLALTKTYNYIIEYNPSMTEPSYYYTYTSNGAYSIKGTFCSALMKSASDKDRLRSLFDIIQYGFTEYSSEFWGKTITKSPECIMLYRSNGSTYNVHLSPKKADKMTTRGFGKYSHIAYYDLSKLYSSYSIPINSTIVLYPGECIFTMVTSNIEQLNLSSTNKDNYNRTIISPRINDYDDNNPGRILYLLGSPSTTLKLSVNAPSRYDSGFDTNGWLLKTGQDVASAGLTLTTLYSSYCYAVEVWIEGTTTFYTVYQYTKLTGNFSSVTSTKSAIII